MQTQTQERRHEHVGQYETVCGPFALHAAELPVNSASDALFSSYCILVKVYFLNSPPSQMVFIDLVYADEAASQRCSIRPR